MPGTGENGGGTAAGKKNVLPARDQAVFRKIVKHYEQKQYRNGLRLANQVLKTHPEHGETLSMKGLILNCQGKREDARDAVKRGLRADIQSHVCWHVYGLFHRSEKKYEEAIKAYRNALARDKDNMQILRDLSLLQIQMRDLDGFKETRYTLLRLRPTQRASWIGYAMSYHLLHEYDTALQILAEFIKGQTEAKTANSFQPASMDFEHSELLLYQNMVLREAGKASEALAHLKEHADAIVDKTQTLELQAQLHVAQGRRAVAAELYRELIQRNPNNRAYYVALEACLDLHSSDARWALYRQLQTQYPRVRLLQIIPLSFLSGSTFREELEKLLKWGLRKGLPSLFQLIRGLYQSPEKAKVVGELVLGFKSELLKGGEELAELATESGGSLPNGTAVNGDADGGELPTTLLWTYYFLAQHLDRLGEHKAALAYVDEALKHTPTLIELHTLKGRIYKHAGATQAAVGCMEEAQMLDTADRFVNCKAAKYLLRSGQVEAAEAMAGKFTREGMEPILNLNEMQCMWFEVESAYAFYRIGLLGLALKRCHEVERHFADIEEDQFDFHTYCVRKMTLCAYVRLLRLEDSLRSHPFYFKAARLAVKIYLGLDEKPCVEEEGGSGGGEEEKEESAAAKAERRKAERKKKKAEAKAEAEKKEPVKKAEKKADPDDLPALVAPLDPALLVKTTKPLDEALKFLLPLIDLQTDEIDAYFLGFRVFWRKQMSLRMTQCLRRAHHLSPLEPKLHVCKINMLLYLDGREESGVVKEIMEEELSVVFGSERDPAVLNEAFLAANKGSYAHLTAAAEAAVLLRGRPGQDARGAELVNAVLKALDAPAGWPDLSFPVVHSAYKKLQRGQLGQMDSVVVQRFRDSAGRRFPLADAFVPDHLLHSLRISPHTPNDHPSSP